jgi:hypothetical protein
MRGLGLSFSRRSPTLLFGLLLLSTHLLWAQRTPPMEKTPMQFLDIPAPPFARVSEAQTPLHLTSRRLPLTFDPNQHQTESRMRFFPHYPDHYRLPFNTDAALSPATRTAELWGKERSLIGNSPSKWLTFAPTYGKVPHLTTYSVENLEHLAHNIPWVGPIILRIGQQAKAHPHFTRLLTVIKPRL